MPDILRFHTDTTAEMVGALLWSLVAEHGCLHGDGGHSDLNRTICPFTSGSPQVLCGFQGSFVWPKDYFIYFIFLIFFNFFYFLIYFLILFF